MTIPCVYPGIWADSGELESTGDPYFANVVNLSHFDGSNASTTFVDSSSHALNLTASGAGALSTSQAKWGTASLSVTNSGGSGTDGAINTGNALYHVGTSDFTIEWWMYPTSFSGARNVVYFNNATIYGFSQLATSGDIVAYLNGATQITGGALTLNAWNFVAYSRVGTTGNLFLAGTSQGTWTDNLNYGTDLLYVGRANGSVNNFSGYIDDFRFTIGTGRYSGSTCPVPSAAFPNRA